MSTHSSVSTRKEELHETETTQITPHSDRQKIERLVEIICGAGDEPAGALFVLMGMVQHSTECEALAHTVKHIAFTHCGERNIYDMVDAQLPVVEAQLLADDAIS
jgi:hypothetical protein